jgi:hypothetical protein
LVRITDSSRTSRNPQTFTNPEVATHLLESKVIELVRDTLLNPEKLQACLEGLECGKNTRHEHLLRQLERFSERIVAVEAQKQRTIDLYASHGLPNEMYVLENRNLDCESKRLRKRKVQIEREVQDAAAHDMVQHSIREYCKVEKAAFERCSTFDLTQRFLREHIKQIVYNRSKVTLVGSVPVRRGTSQPTVPVPFRIEGELDRRAIRARPHKLQPDDGRWKKLPQTHLPVVAKEAAVSSV